MVLKVEIYGFMMKILLPTGKTAHVRRWVGSIWDVVPWGTSGRKVQVL